jgi:hypothetical protein
MAGLKKSSKKDANNPNTALVIALVLFILVSIGLGVFAYFGYDGQEALRQAAKKANQDKKTAEEQRDNYALLGIEAMLAEGLTLTPDQRTAYVTIKRDFEAIPDKFNEVKEPVLKAIFAEHAKNLKGYNANDAKYESNYKVEITKALEDAKKSRALLEATQKEYNEFKSNYDTLQKKHEKDIQEMLDRIQKGNQDTLAAALKTNTKFPEVQKALAESEADRKKRDEEQTKEVEDLLSQIARINRDKIDLEKKLNDRALGVSLGPQGSAGDVHALVLDVSRGLPLWDRPLGKVVRVDAANLLVTIDLGTKAGIKPDVTFNVFATGPGGKADRQLKGTVEVVRVVNETTSTCRITSLYDSSGESIPLQSEGLRSRAIRATDEIMREGDLLFNTFFDAHVFIAGSVNFIGYNADSPAAQNLQLQDFMTQLRKQGIAVDGYLNLLNGQVEGTITPKTRLLIRGDIAKINSTEEETIRYKQLIETYQVLKRQAIEQGMFIISAENFAIVTGYRPPQGQNVGSLTNFRPSLPWTGGPVIQRFDRAVEGAAAPMPPMPMPAPELKKEE